ncbi:cobalamin biosynthesis protein [Candidatus Chlorohelix sp.]|uniref:cobalamin biosynthesis protein n=1 Tax=Candidatus Chlorohelix sp. TaxID=3139201 RepID=UPI0030691583
MLFPFPLEYLIALLIAVAYDLAIGEPPALVHPVVGMGKLVSLWERIAPSKNPALQFIFGLSTLLISIGGLFALSWWGFSWLRTALPVPAIILEAYLLKSCFSLKMLGDSGLKIRQILSAKTLEEARFEMRDLVSRNTAQLSEPLIIAATIESVAENTTDSFVSPLMFFALFGVPGALAYRLANTFDSMIGYRGKYEYLGKAAARFDDLLNYLPARLTALLLIINARWYKGNRANAWRIALRDHNKTASPNAGWTMAAIAGAMKVQLEKSGHYTLGDGEKPVTLHNINQTVAALYFVAMEMVILFAMVATIFTIVMLS